MSEQMLPPADSCERTADPGLVSGLPLLPAESTYFSSSLDLVEKWFERNLSPATYLDIAAAIEGMPRAQVETLQGLLRTSIRPKTSEQIHAHEDTWLKPPNALDIASGATLKHQALYCAATALEDPLRQVSTEQRVSLWKKAFIDGLRQLAPVAELVRYGYIVLDVPRRYNQHLYNQNGRVNFAVICFADNCHYVAQLAMKTLEDHPELSEAWQNRNFLTPQFPDKEFMQAFSKYYPGHIDMEKLYRAMEFLFSLQFVGSAFSKAMPITSDPVIQRHIDLEQRAKFQGISDIYRPSSNMLPVSYQVPELSGVSFDDLAALRRDEAVFSKLHMALARLVLECAKVKRPESIESYREFLTQCAADIVRPELEEIEKLLRRARMARFASKVIFNGATLGIGTYINLVGEGLELLGDPLVDKVGKSRIRNAQIACSILQTIALHQQKR